MRIVFLKKWAYPGLFFIYFRLFKHTLQFLQQINVKKYPSSIRYRDSNPRPLGRESLPITTRPGLQPKRRGKCYETYILHGSVLNKLWKPVSISHSAFK